MVVEVAADDSEERPRIAWIAGIGRENCCPGPSHTKSATLKRPSKWCGAFPESRLELKPRPSRRKGKATRFGFLILRHL